MIIRITKGKNRPNTLTCVRDDGSVTWQANAPFFAYHDVIHYAVETTLGYKEAFYGLLAQGRDIDSFGTRNGVKDVYTVEEGWAETIVGMLQWPSLSEAEFFDMLASHCSEHNLTIPPITSEQLAQIRTQIHELHQRWEQVPEGESLELSFPPAH